jgi:trehalose-6-phosphatase
VRGLEAIHGEKVVEVRPRGLHKGLVAPRALAGAGEEKAVIALGDDRTDEDLFAALPASAISIPRGRGRERGFVPAARPNRGPAVPEGAPSVGEGDCIGEGHCVGSRG